MIVEKAYAKLNGSYRAIVSGHENEALQDLTGGVPINITLHPPEAREDRWQGAEGEQALWDYLSILISEGTSHLGCSKKNNAGGRSTQIFDHHAYGVLDLQEIESSSPFKKIVRIRNPWGEGKEWDGQYC